MSIKNKHSLIKIKEAINPDFFDFKICAGEFGPLLDKLNENAKKHELFILTAYSNNILAGILISEQMNQKVDSVNTIVPTSLLYLIYVNPFFRNKGLGKKLLNYYLIKQKFLGIATIYMNIPQKYKMGTKFLLKNNFHQTFRSTTTLIFKYNLWNDYGIRDSILIGEHFNCFLD